MQYRVELFGMTNDMAGIRHVEVDLPNGASLKGLIGALRAQLPVLEGSVIEAGEDRLTRHYVFNVNGRFYVGDDDVKITSEDRILLLTFALGG